MPDQLSLELAARVPRLPDGLRPMLPRPASAPFDSAEHLFEPSWGGRRALAYVEPDPSTGAFGVRLLDGQGRDLAPMLPELGVLASAVGAPMVVLDGEVIVPNGAGRSDDRALRERLGRSGLGGAGSGDNRLAGPRGRGFAPVYLAFDLLYLEGRPLLGLPLVRRRELLASLVKPAPAILVVPATPGDGRALFEAAVAQRLPGILARHLRSPYLAGRRSGLWRSISTTQAAQPQPADQPDRPSDDAPGGQRPVLALIRKLPLLLDDLDE